MNSDGGDRGLGLKAKSPWFIREEAIVSLTRVVVEYATKGGDGRTKDKEEKNTRRRIP